MLETQIGPLTFQEWGLLVVGLVVVFGVINWLKGRGGGAGEQNLTWASCMGCQWQGRVSKYHRTCPKCGNNITRIQKNEQL